MVGKRKKTEPPAPLLKLNLACGQRRYEDYLGVDRIQTEATDLVVDLDVFPWPWADGSVEKVWCAHYVEHAPDLMAFMNELGRVMLPGGTAVIVAPYYTSMRAWQDPTHVRAISEASFLYFNKGWRTDQKLDHYPITCDFDFTYGYALEPGWATRSQEARDFAVKHYLNVVADLHVTLTRR